MSKNRKYLMPLILGLVFCVLIALNSSVTEAHTITITSPSTNSLVNGTFNFTATITYSPFKGDNISNVSFYYSTDGSTWTLFGSMVNATDDDPVFEYVATTTSWTESASYYINATAYPDIAGTTFNCTDVNTGITIDNTNPTAVMDLPSTTLDIKHLGGLIVDCSNSVDAIDSALTAIFYLTTPSDATSTQTWSATLANTSKGDLTYEFTDAIDNSNDFIFDEYGDYIATCRVFDDIQGGKGVEATNQTISVGSKKTPAETLIVSGEAEKEAVKPGILNFRNILILIILLCVIAVIVYYETKKD